MRPALSYPYELRVEKHERPYVIVRVRPRHSEREMSRFRDYHTAVLRLQQLNRTHRSHRRRPR